jgi:corrinoid protein of di/trimethylamine methyltransferase
MVELKKLYQAVLDGDQKTAVAVTHEALEAGHAAMELISDYMVPAMDEVGRRFACEDYFVPELLLSARAMKGSMKLLRPLLAASGVEPTARVLIGSVKGDLHDIGKNLVGSMLEGGGFEVIDLGADVPPEKFVEAIRGKRVNIVALSALLTVTMPAMRTTIEALREAGLRDSVKVMVGGAPVTAEFAEEIGADGYSESAGGAVGVARRLAQQKKEAGAQ